MPCRVASIAHEILELELTEPFGISGGQHDVARLVLVRLQLADGSEGLGEAAPLPAYDGETIADAVAAIEQSTPSLLGLDARDFRRCASAIRPLTRDSAAARCALETALCDALARHLGLPLARLFGGAEAGPLQTDVTIPIVDAESARDAARRRFAEGFRHLKIKIGGEGDVDRVLAAHAGAPEAAIRLDANGGLRAADALDLLDELSRGGVVVELFEQPVAKDDWRGLERVAQRCRVALDESVVSSSDALVAAERLGSPHVINVKLMKSGIVEAMDVVAVARAAGLGLMIGGMVESTLAMSTSASFALGLGGFELIDLDTPLFIRRSPFRGGIHLDGPTLSISADAGHGVRALESPAS